MSYTVNEADILWDSVPSSSVRLMPPFRCLVMSCDECETEMASGLPYYFMFPDSVVMDASLQMLRQIFEHSKFCSKYQEKVNG